MVKAEKSPEQAKIRAEILSELRKLIMGSSSGWNPAHRRTLNLAFPDNQDLVDEILKEQGYLN